MGFSPRIHDRSQPPAFPRSIKIRDRPASYQFLEEMISRFKYACKVIKYKDYYSALVGEMLTRNNASSNTIPFFNINLLNLSIFT